MIRVAIVEDEEAVREQLLGYVQRYTRQYGTTFEVRTFSDGVEILEGYRPVFDLILLDVEMKHLDGMETAQRIRALDSDVMIVFITNMAQYAIKGYAVGALDYVLKPVPYFAFSQQLQKAEEQLRRLNFLDLNGKDLALDRMRTEELTYALARRLNIPVVSGSDTHQAVQYGCVTTVFQREVRSVAALKAEMDAGRYEIQLSDTAAVQVRTACLLKRSLKEIHALGGDYVSILTKEAIA